MAEQRIITDEDSNAYLERYFGKGAYPCFPDSNWTTDRLIMATANIDEYASVEVESGESYSLAQLTRWCTPRQKQVVRVARDCAKVAALFGRTDWQAMLAAQLGVTQPAVSRILRRIDERVCARRAELGSRDPLPATWAEWRREMRRKQMLVYHRPPRGWISAYLHEQRWRRRRGR